MASRPNPLGNQSSKKPTTIQLQVKSEQEIVYSLKKRKEINSASEKFCNEVDEQKSCPLCNRNLLVTATECNNPCDLCCKETEPKLKGYGRMCDADNPHDTSRVIPAVLDQQPAIIEDPRGLWRGNAVGQLEKEMFWAVEDRYPQTFQRLDSIPK
ncbi:uncharacterized protein LOC110887481 isoform X2 [Helianthus annuus]|uniref:uncharacterized protein LOC110887481 isoform X2 n=1 Tax=Helianthus annuus TaxID=4232 RepID=UPI0016530969|nr:uncharacterized protein LOC110887481 isoform X2 [Helianthus annuus]